MTSDKKGRDHLKDPGADGKIILKRMREIWFGVWTLFI
jgi:hypothetical protein